MKLFIFVGVLQVLKSEFLKFRMLEIWKFHPCEYVFWMTSSHRDYPFWLLWEKINQKGNWVTHEYKHAMKENLSFM